MTLSVVAKARALLPSTPPATPPRGPASHAVMAAARESTHTRSSDNRALAAAETWAEDTRTWFKHTDIKIEVFAAVDGKVGNLNIVMAGLILEYKTNIIAKFS